MPAIIIEGPKIDDLEAKRELVKKITAAAADAYKMPEEIMVVMIKENSPENVGVGGELIIDRHKSPPGD